MEETWVGVRQGVMAVEELCRRLYLAADNKTDRYGYRDVKNITTCHFLHHPTVNFG